MPAYSKVFYGNIIPNDAASLEWIFLLLKKVKCSAWCPWLVELDGRGVGVATRAGEYLGKATQVLPTKGLLAQSTLLNMSKQKYVKKRETRQSKRRKNVSSAINPKKKRKGGKWWKRKATKCGAHQTAWAGYVSHTVSPPSKCQYQNININGGIFFFRNKLKWKYVFQYAFKFLLSKHCLNTVLEPLKCQYNNTNINIWKLRRYLE